MERSAVFLPKISIRSHGQECACLVSVPSPTAAGQLDAGGRIDEGGCKQPPSTHMRGLALGDVSRLGVDRLGDRGLALALADALAKAGCEMRGDDTACGLDARIKPATEADWSTEYLDAIVSIKTVDGVKDAIHHINHYGSHHTDAILAEDSAATEAFLNGVDSGIVMVNASTQFADGGEFGMGAEIGISTGKLHARGPVGVEQLTSYKYVVRGTGQTRP